MIEWCSFLLVYLKENGSFQLLVRMEMPGHYQINPIKLEAMYAKDVRAYSSLDTLEVKE